MDNVRAIKNDIDLAWAIGEVAIYFDNLPEPGSPEAERFDVLSDLIEVYEDRFHPVDEPEPIAMLKEFMKATGKTQSDLSLVLGSRSRASEVLNKKRPLNIDMVGRLSRTWNIPTDPLVAPYHLATGYRASRA